MHHRIALSVMILSATAPATAAEMAAPGSDIVVTAQRANQTEMSDSGDLGVLGAMSGADAPFSIRSYNAALILNEQPQTLGQLLETDPSVRTTYGFGNAAEQFVIRGFPLTSDDVGFDGLYGITPRQLVAPELYESVQVLNGASAFLNGAAPGGTGIGGSVNLIPKRAGTDPLTRLTGNFMASGNFGGSFDVSRRLGGGSLGVRVNGAFRAGDVAVDDEFRRTSVLGMALDWTNGPLRLSLDLGYQRIHIRDLRPKVTINSATVPAVPDASQNYGQQFTYTTMRDFFGEAKLEWDVADNATLYAAFGARDGMEDGIYGGITVNDAATGDAQGTALYVPRTDNNEALQAGMRVRLQTGPISHQFNFGGSHIWQVNRNAYDFRYGPGFAGFATNLYDTVQVDLPSSSLVGGDLANPQPRVRIGMDSAFVSDTIGLLNDRILITGGMRMQSIDSTTYSYTDGSIEQKYKKSAVTPVAGIVVKPTDAVSLYANRIESLAAGPTAPLTSFYPGLGTLPVSNAGEIFAPYRAVQYEVGGKLFLGRLTATAAWFQTSQPIAQAMPDPGNPLALRYGLTGKQRNSGVEFSLSGDITSHLRLIAGASIIAAKLHDTPAGLTDGNRAQGVPDYTANANVEYDLPFVPGLTLTGHAILTGAQKLNTDNTLSIPAWQRFDVGVRYVASISNRPVTLRAGVDNVGNRRYWASAYDAFSQTLLQGQPRTFKASVSVDF